MWRYLRKSWCAEHEIDLCSFGHTFPFLFLLLTNNSNSNFVIALSRLLHWLTGNSVHKNNNCTQKQQQQQQKQHPTIEQQKERNKTIKTKKLKGHTHTHTLSRLTQCNAFVTLPQHKSGAPLNVQFGNTTITTRTTTTSLDTTLCTVLV